VLPFDEALGLPDDFSRRIARNTSSLLIAESQVGRVLDPGGGSFAIEKLTHDLANAGWGALQEIDAQGGIVQAVRTGFLEGRVSDVRVRRETRIATRYQPITGVSEFPNPDEVPLERSPRVSPHEEPVQRYAAPFETLRDRPRPRPVYLATLGSIALHTPRAMFATNLLVAGGIPMQQSGPCETGQALVTAYAGEAVAVLAGPDSAYDEWGTQAVAALRAAGVRWVIGVGASPDLGCDETFSRGDDAVAFLTRTREQLS
jgi:methylmalonyl-CoA mutase